MKRQFLSTEKANSCQRFWLSFPPFFLFPDNFLCLILGVEDSNKGREQHLNIGKYQKPPDVAKGFPQNGCDIT
jgi:hypothetical protein